MIKEKHSLIYDREIKNLRAKSVFLNEPPSNDGSIRFSVEYTWRTENPNQIRARIKHYKEKLIPALEREVKEIEMDFERYCQGQENQGYRRPGTMPPDLKEKWDIASARLQVTQEELQVLEKALKESEKKEEVDELPCLKYGPQGQGKLKDGVLIYLDGQKIKPDRHGTLMIQDKRSPYNGMHTADYFDYIVKPYKKKLAEYLVRGEKEGRERQKLIELYKLKGEEIPPDLSPIFSKKRPGLPPWPEQVARPIGVR